MTDQNIPPKPAGSFRVVLNQLSRGARLDAVLMDALRNQSENLDLKNISRMQFKKLFNDKKIRIKGQAARPASTLSGGTTYIDIHGYE